MSETEQTDIFIDVDEVFAGGASNLCGIAGAGYSLQNHRRLGRYRLRPVRRIGTSAGSILSAGLTFGVTASKFQDHLVDFLADNKLLDANPLVNLPTEFGICSGDALREAVASVVGDKTKMGDAPTPLAIVVGDLYEGKPTVITSWGDPECNVADTVAASSAMPWVFKRRQIQGWQHGNRRLRDGGCAMNFAMNFWDDVPERPTIGVRLKQTTEIIAPRDWDFLEAAKADARLFMWSSDNGHMSSKHYAHVVDIHGEDGMDFSLTRVDIMRRWKAGESGALAARFPFVDDKTTHASGSHD